MRYFKITLIAFFLYGCGDSDTPRKPDNLISKDKMSDIIYDVFLMNAAKGINKRILENNGILPQEYVYKKYSIDSLQFVLSNNYYSYNTKTYEDIMAKVKQRIESEKTKYDSISSQEDRVKDSIYEAAKKANKSDTLTRLKPKMKPKILVDDKS